MDCFGESKGMPASASFVALLAGMSGTGRSHIALTVGSLRLPPCHGAFNEAELMSVPVRHSGHPETLRSRSISSPLHSCASRGASRSETRCTSTGLDPRTAASGSGSDRRLCWPPRAPRFSHGSKAYARVMVKLYVRLRAPYLTKATIASRTGWRRDLRSPRPQAASRLRVGALRSSRFLGGCSSTITSLPQDERAEAAASSSDQCFGRPVEIASPDLPYTRHADVRRV
jgi:hypothetical protein